MRKYLIGIFFACLVTIVFHYLVKGFAGHEDRAVLTSLQGEDSQGHRSVVAIAKQLADTSVIEGAAKKLDILDGDSAEGEIEELRRRLVVEIGQNSNSLSVYVSAGNRNIVSHKFVNAVIEEFLKLPGKGAFIRVDKWAAPARLHYPPGHYAKLVLIFSIVSVIGFGLAGLWDNRPHNFPEA